MDVFRAKTAILAVSRRTAALVDVAFFKRYGFNPISLRRLEIIRFFGKRVLNIRIEGQALRSTRVRLAWTGT
ncbi:hypothetical protein [Paraburkholderia sp.]|uniref:hypothetical protein n=1 Tax=Paraburkholderia sp. TaxID=1926495 RepID=UPI0025EC2050|nr:hypothetical protein [Paraburkholderia sp.]